MSEWTELQVGKRTYALNTNTGQWHYDCKYGSRQTNVIKSQLTIDSLNRWLAAKHDQTREVENG